MLGSAMYIWCNRQQIRHWTSRRLQSKLSSPSSIPLVGVLAVITLWTFLSKLSGLTRFAFSSSVGKQISKRIWTAALSYKQIKHSEFKKFLRSLFENQIWFCFHMNTCDKNNCFFKNKKQRGTSKRKSEQPIGQWFSSFSGPWTLLRIWRKLYTLSA